MYMVDPCACVSDSYASARLKHGHGAAIWHLPLGLQRFRSVQALSLGRWQGLGLGRAHGRIRRQQMVETRQARTRARCLCEAAQVGVAMKGVESGGAIARSQDRGPVGARAETAAR